MKAVVYRGIGDIRIENVSEPQLKEDTDAIVRLTASAICGTDLHMVRGTFPGMEPGTILGHEGVGVVEEIGDGVRNLKPGDRVVIPSTIACGACSYCRWAISRSAITPTPTDGWPELRSSAGLLPAGPSMDCRQNSRGFLSPTSAR